MIRAVTIFALFFASSLHAETIKLAVTTSFHNSGLSDVLLPVIKDETGLDVQLLIVGTGQALRLGRAGDVDAILVHSKSAEEAFVKDGFATHRREIMYNDFVLVGPDTDPAGIRTAQTAIEALHMIHASKQAFVSRGDDSGTHKKELALWIAAGSDANEFGRWYKSVGAGMGASLNTASGLNAYILTDRASWLNFGNRGDLVLLFSGDDMLFNQYAYLAVNPEVHRHVNHSAAVKLENWLTSKSASAIIDGFTIDGQKLFIFNAMP